MANHIVKSGETGYAIAKKHGMPFKTLQKLNPTVDWNKMPIGQSLVLSASTKTATTARANTSTTQPKQSYTVKPGDTGWAISRRLNIPLDVLQAANPEIDLTKLKPNQILKTTDDTISTAPKAKKTPNPNSGSIFDTQISNETLMPTFSTTNKKTVMLDAGHGQSNKGITDPGAINGDAKESNITQTAVIEIKKELEEVGFNVILGKRDSLKNRQKEKIKTNPDYYLSIHVNSAKNKTANGEEVLYAGNDDKAFATAINKKLKDDNTIEKNRGVKHRPELAVLKKDPKKTKSALVELGFLSNEKDKNVLTNNELLKKQAKLIAKGLEAYDNSVELNTNTKNQIAKKAVEKENEILNT